MTQPPVNGYDEPYLGRRVHDLLSALDWLRAGGARDVHLVGRGMGSVIAAFSALLAPDLRRVTLCNYLPSYELLVSTPLHNWPLSALVRGALREFDLQDVYAALRPRLVLQAPWDARMRTPRRRELR